MATVNPQAQELNDVIASVNPNILTMLSDRGLAAFFPKMGILAQAADAKGKEINATIGIALEDDGAPLRLECVERMIDLPPADVFPYAPSYGRPDLRATWKSMIIDKNPSLDGHEIGNPVVTNALTHGLSMCGYLFGNAGDQLITPDLYWGNYRLIFASAYGVQPAVFPTFADGKFNVAGLRETIFAAPVGRCIVSLNFPNNPTGYTPTAKEGQAITNVLLEACDAGYDVVALIDDAYFGLVYEEGVMTESLFADLANAHERLLAVKIDGATKEDYVWGFRVGFITFGIKGGTAALYQALEAKLAGAIRGNISNASNLSQSLLNAAYKAPDYARQKQEKYDTLKKRYDKVKEILASHPEYEEQFTALPFNSGYFMCLRTVSADPEAVRQKLLADYSTGIIVANGVMRLAFSSTPYPLLEQLLDNIHEATKQLSG